MPKCVIMRKGKYNERADAVVYWCPGCKERHGVPVQKADGVEPPSWNWNSSFESPSLVPSVRLGASCHHVMTHGRINYGDDCTHPLAGTVVPMVEVDEEGYAIA